MAWPACITLAKLSPTVWKNPRGKQRQHADSGIGVYRHFASDRPTEHALVTLNEWLKGRIESGDVVSVSLVVRRAICLYLSHVSALVAAGNLDEEREAICANSRMPSKNPRKNKPYTRARKPKKTLGRPPRISAAAPAPAKQ